MRHGGSATAGAALRPTMRQRGAGFTCQCGLLRRADRCETCAPLYAEQRDQGNSHLLRPYHPAADCESSPVHWQYGGAGSRTVATAPVSLPYRRRGPGCSPCEHACCLSVRVTVAALLFTCGVLCRGVDHPRRRAPRQSSAAASGAAAADSQALGPAAALSRTDFLRGTDSSIYPGQAAPGAGARAAGRGEGVELGSKFVLFSSAGVRASLALARTEVGGPWRGGPGG